MKAKSYAAIMLLFLLTAFSGKDGKGCHEVPVGVFSAELPLKTNVTI